MQYLSFFNFYRLFKDKKITNLTITCFKYCVCFKMEEQISHYLKIVISMVKFVYSRKYTSGFSFYTVWHTEVIYRIYHKTKLVLNDKKFISRFISLNIFQMSVSSF